MGETEQETKQGTKKVGLGQKIAFGLVMAVASGIYFIIFLNWVLMVPAQNLPYPYK